MIYKGVLCIVLCWNCLSSIKLFQSYNSQPIPYVIVRRSSLSITCLHWRHFLYEIGIWLKTGSCRKRKAVVRIRFVQVVCCNFSYTNFNVYIEKIIKHTQHEAGGPNIRAITPKCLSGSKASVSFPNDSLLPLYRSLCFMVARASVAQEGSSSVARSPKNGRWLKIHRIL